MSELDEAWEFGLAQAAARARAAGRTDIAEYLALRTSNDLIRKIASDWLFTLFTTAAGDANRAGTSIQTSTQDPHRFKVGNAVMVGKGLELVRGVRRLLLEVGWPRTPPDGFIRAAAWLAQISNTSESNAPITNYALSSMPPVHLAGRSSLSTNQQESFMKPM